MNVPVCQICKDPIWSFICPECLGKDIGEWLPEGLSPGFSRFHEFITKSFSPISYKPIFVPCIKCKRTTVATICPFCYVAEAVDWLRTKNASLSGTLMKFLPLSNDWKISKNGGCVWKEGIRPVAETEIEIKDFGMCDDCGEYSGELSKFNGKWVCEDCKK